MILPEPETDNMMRSISETPMMDMAASVRFLVQFSRQQDDDVVVDTWENL